MLRAIRSPKSILTLGDILSMEERSTNAFRVLLASDELDVESKATASLLETRGYDCVRCRADARLLQSRMRDEVSVLLYLTRDISSFFESELDKLVQHFPEIPCIVLSKKPNAIVAQRAVSAGVFWALSIPFYDEELLHLVARACVVHELSVDNKVLRSLLEGQGTAAKARFTGTSLRMQELMANAEKVASLSSTILLTGESGTGKTTLARHIHSVGPRASKPFVLVSCGAIPRDLIEAELFGYVKGAFTGAAVSRPGSFELADGGTLFLDEIGELPLELQPKLLNVLQDRSVKRIGDTKSQSVDVRVIAATNRDLEVMCEDGEFREDLFYRLHVLAMEIPPLRARVEDIRFLAKLFLSEIALAQGVEVPPLGPSALQALERYSWPGNARELYNVLERAVAFSNGGILDEKSLGIKEKMRRQASGVDSIDLSSLSLAEIERLALEATLRACGGDKRAVAERLGVSLKTVYNKLKRHELQ